MTKPIRSFLLCTLFACSMAFAAPQQPPTDQAPPPPQPQTLRQRLALTKEQAVASLSPSARKQKIRSIHAAAEMKIRAILNENQLTEYDQIKREHHEQAVRNHQTALPPQ